MSSTETLAPRVPTGAGAGPPLLIALDAGGVLTLTLNRPEARNALSVGLMDRLQGAIEEADRDPQVRVVVIAANGPAFCAGHDLREIRANPGRAAATALFRQCSHLMQSIVRNAKPVIARVHGVATAAGCQLVASCDLAVAARSARFATPGVHIGLFCSTPMVALSRAVGRKAAMEMLLLGELIDAEQALAWGLINRVVAEAELESAALALARQIAAKSPLTLKLGKQAFYRQAELPLADAYAHANEVMTQNLLARDAQEGIDAFLYRREPQWKGE